MKEISIQEMKGMQLDILRHVHDYCMQNHLCYSIGYGTLIGAIRHRGYIPWDDDIDVMMPRPDYDKFVANYKDKAGVFRVVDYKSRDTIAFPFSKVEDCRTTLKGTMSEFGISIDVFPIDIVPNDENERNAVLTRYEKLILQLERTTNFYKINSSLYQKVRNVIKRIVFYIIYPSRKRIIQELDDLIYAYNWNDEFANMSYTVLGSPYRRKEIGKFEDYVETIDVEFEGEFFKCIKNYERNLTQIYGDYMKLPPLEKRVLTHGYTPYWK